MMKSLKMQGSQKRGSNLSPSVPTKHRSIAVGTFMALGLMTACADADTEAQEPQDNPEQTTEASAEGESGQSEQDNSAGESGNEEENPSDSENDESSEDETDEPEPVAELPGGGDTVFPDRRMVGLYGHPGTPGLGVLGHEDIDTAVDHVQDCAEEYAEFSDEPVIPAFEIITTVASSDPGPDGDYTNEIDPEELEPWIEAAAQEEIYVVLDLQPGRKDFLSQAELYEDLLREPHVGLALDPEWRITEEQEHMQQIGSVSAEEINETADWLAELTSEEDLPQKVFMIHQFTHPMIQDRESIDTSHEELAMVLHADGHGALELKRDVYDQLQTDLPDEMWMAWKNFYSEDDPTFTPEETYQVDPKPWFVSYQ